MSYNKIYRLISHPKIDIIINNFWRGPYENEFFLNNSSSYKIILNEFANYGRYIDYKPEIDNLFDFQKIKLKSKCTNSEWNIFKYKHYK